MRTRRGKAYLTVVLPLDLILVLTLVLPQPPCFGVPHSSPVLGRVGVLTFLLN